jgi:D-alanyl-lipoteichoic acid acyltransferase DltB (MBOAT superfamily)
MGKWIKTNVLIAPNQKLKISIAICLSLSLLLMTKYYEFIREIFDDVLRSIGVNHQLPYLEVIIPAGISFFTFQAITYLVWQNKNESQDIKQQITFVDVLLYLAFWPTLFAGPIFRAKDFFEQLYGPLVGAAIQVEKAMYFILLGLLQKMVLANWLSTSFVDDVFAYPAQQNFLSVSSGAWAYALQIFFDFSGYTLLVTGLGLLLGYQVPINFRQPYLAKNLQEFWKRWHISLSSFIRDYIYIPLGGNKFSFTRTQVNIFIAMTLSGIWHGANLTFIFWGVLHALGVIFINVNNQYVKIKIPQGLAYILTLVFICMTWVFFRSDNIDNAISLFKQLGNLTGNFKVSHLLLFLLSVLFFTFSKRSDVIEQYCTTQIKKWWGWRLGLVITASIYLIIYAGPSGIPAFIYYRF